MALLRPIIEEGIVVSKAHKDATKSFVDKSGKIVPEREERFIAKVVSSFECKADTGMTDATILDYEVTPEMFDKLKYGTKVRVKFNMSSASEKPKADSIIAILDNGPNEIKK